MNCISVIAIKTPNWLDEQKKNKEMEESSW